MRQDTVAISSLNAGMTGPNGIGFKQLVRYIGSDNAPSLRNYS